MLERDGRSMFCHQTLWGDEGEGRGAGKEWILWRRMEREDDRGRGGDMKSQKREVTHGLPYKPPCRSPSTQSAPLSNES